MINRERLYAIPELTVAGGLDKLSDRQLGMYLDSVNSFIDRFPAQSQRLQDAVDDEAQASMISGIYVPICDTLTRLHANGIVKEYRPKFDKLVATAEIDYEALEALVENFIQTVSSLSIDIQMAMRPGAPPPSSRPAPAAGAGGAAQKPQTKQIYSRESHKILAVDNAVMYLNTLKKMLESTSYDLHTTTSCAEALEYVRSNHPSLLLLDIEMPEMDGYELARQIRAGGCRAPIIFITANSAREYVDRALEVGAEGLLMKPLRSNQLLAKLAEFL